ncbi:MAG: heme exporter protein CcmD [Betaproteobacteria bacterium]|jgi:heme exporter protein D|nr:heme exporter protein CcmD [Betaproteobacteria bacterium]
MTDFLHMGGYGWFVWGSYGVAALALALELVALRQRRRNALAQAREAGQAAP